MHRRHGSQLTGCALAHSAAHFSPFTRSIHSHSAAAAARLQLSRCGAHILFFTPAAAPPPQSRYSPRTEKTVSSTTTTTAALHSRFARPAASLADYSYGARARALGYIYEAVGQCSAATAVRPPGKLMREIDRRLLARHHEVSKGCACAGGNTHFHADRRRGEKGVGLDYIVVRSVERIVVCRVCCDAPMTTILSDSPGFGYCYADGDSRGVIRWWRGQHAGVFVGDLEDFFVSDSRCFHCGGA